VPSPASRAHRGEATIASCTTRSSSLNLSYDEDARIRDAIEAIELINRLADPTRDLKA